MVPNMSQEPSKKANIGCMAVIVIGVILAMAKVEHGSAAALIGGFLTLLRELQPLSENDYSNRFGEKLWTIGRRKVGMTFRMEFLRG
jgi:hypothetical protein